MSSEYAPRLTEPIQALYIIREGQPVKLSCRFDANPKGEIQWLKDGIPIDFAELGISRDFTVSSKSFFNNEFYFFIQIGCKRNRLYSFINKRSVSRRCGILYSFNS